MRSIPSIKRFLLCAALAATAGAAQNAPLPPSQPLPAIPPPGRIAVQPQFVVVLDAAHGGNDSGARIGDRLLEKDLTLAFLLRLRAALASHQIQVVTTRDVDSLVSMQSRAEAANHALAAACITLHATGTGSGVHLFTSSLAPATGGRFQPWQSAQSGYITQSLRLSSEINTALGHSAVPVTLGRASLQPMDSFACPAVAVEVAPLAAGNSVKAAPLSDDAYQARVISALAAALVQWQNDWRQQP